MKSKTLSTLTRYVFLWSVACVILVSTGQGMEFPNKFIAKKDAVTLLGASFFLLLYLTALRVISYYILIEPSILWGQSAESLVFTYYLNYILLTDEARSKFREIINKKRERADEEQQQISSEIK